MQRAPAILLPFVLVLATIPATAQISFTDDLQRTVTLETPAARIISLAPSITETLFALGAADRVVAVTDYCNYPEAARTKRSIGGIVNPNAEAIISLSPDIIILSMEGNIREDFSTLEALEIPLFVTNPRTLAGIRKSILDLGVISGTGEMAAKIVHEMKEREDSIRLEALPQSRVLMVVSLQPLMVVGTGTFLAEVLRIAGADNVAAGTGMTYPVYSREAVVASNPDLIVLTSDIFLPRDELLKLFPEWRTLNATRSGRVFSIGADIVSRPGPRIIQALEQLHEMLK